jgi:hypothetical protein
MSILFVVGVPFYAVPISCGSGTSSCPNPFSKILARLARLGYKYYYRWALGLGE